MLEIPVREACPVLQNPQDEKYAEAIRQFQGCPTIAITRGGRIFAGWYAGGPREPHMENYNLLVCSDDDGASWRGPIAVIPSVVEECIHALDIQLWTDPDGRLWVFWVQERTRPAVENDTAFVVDGYAFGVDKIHGEWAMVCENPDAGELVFSTPRRLDDGFLRCKPLALRSGRWLNFNYDQNCNRYGYSISDDKGQSWTRRYGCEKIATPFDEAMAVEKKDGAIHMMARTQNAVGALAETFSYDNGQTWNPARRSAWPDPSSRFYYGRTPTGNLLLVKNDDAHSRCNMTAFLSTDDGASWPYRALIDPRNQTSYPDVDFYDGKIYLVHDFERTGSMEILLSVFAEEDIIQGRPITPRVISKP